MPNYRDRLIFAEPEPPIQGHVFSPAHWAHVPEAEMVNSREAGPIHRDVAYPCPHCGEIICASDSVEDHMTYVADREAYWCNDCRDAEGVTYMEDRGNWYLRPPAQQLPGYHSLIRDKGSADRDNPFRIGLEIEKEDADLRNALIKRKLALPIGWVYERDGSLNETTGIEVVTRAYNLCEIDELKADFTKAEKVFKAAFSKACGGHISISDIRYTPMELSERIKPLFPLLMALYPKRLTLKYAIPAKDKEKGTKGHHAAFSFAEERKGNRIELRIPSAVRSVSTALWRVELISYFLLKSKDRRLTWEFMKTELRDGGFVKEMLRKIYTRPTIDDKEKKIRNVLQKYRAFAGWYYNDNSPQECIQEYLSQYRVMHTNPRRESDHDLQVAPRGTRYYGYFNARCECQECATIRRDAPNERIREAEALRNRTERQKCEEERRIMERRVSEYERIRGDQYTAATNPLRARADITSQERERLIRQHVDAYHADVRAERAAAEAEMMANRRARHAREQEEARAAQAAAMAALDELAGTTQATVQTSGTVSVRTQASWHDVQVMSRYLYSTQVFNVGAWTTQPPTVDVVANPGTPPPPSVSPAPEVSAEQPEEDDDFFELEPLPPSEDDDLPFA